MQLVSTRQIPERPANFDIARRILRDVLREEPHAYFLWTGGRWVHATVDDIMRRANEYRKYMGHAQFAGKAEWLVQ